MTVGQLLREADSHELTEWQAWYRHRQQAADDKDTGGRIKWDVDD